MLNNFSYSKTFHLCLVFFLTLTIVGSLSVTQVDPHHDGIMLKPAVDVANGKMLFRDTFSQYGPLTTLIQVLAIKLFGKYLMVIRLLTALFYGLISILIWLIYSRILPKWLNTFSVVIWLFLGYFFINGPSSLIYPWSTVYAVFSVLLSLYFLILFFERQHFIFLLLTGISTSLVFWFKINYGIISLFSILLILLVIKKNFIKSILIFLLGYCIIHAIFFIWLIINNSLEDFYLQTIKLTFVFSNNI
ncbi:MAG: glycosyltransferase family 39 protein, partial [Flavobacterium sp.]|nr:glycosyltransferase family 39 protein [Flavobacterium sp.]